jgi:hypothetical protein
MWSLDLKMWMTVKEELLGVGNQCKGERRGRRGVNGIAVLLMHV